LITSSFAVSLCPLQGLAGDCHAELQDKPDPAGVVKQLRFRQRVSISDQQVGELALRQEAARLHAA
jgi:hypothetical protein